jgi:lysine-N-methylase
MTRPVFTLQYMTRFRCIADLCEDTCCSGMQILLSDQNRETLAGALGRDAAELAEKLVPLPDAPYGYPWALRRDEGGTCAFLDGQRLCTLVSRFGDGVLPDPCALFPTVQQQTGREVELVASLACPEAARLCLLAEDAVERVEAPPVVSSRLRPKALLSIPAGDEAAKDALRERGRALLQDRTRALPDRLLSLWGLQGDAVPAESPDALPGEPVIQALVALVTGLQERGSVRYNQLVNAVLPTYQLAALEADPRTGQPDGPPLWSMLWRVFVDKRARAQRVLGRHLEPALERYWVNDWHREPFTRSPSLPAHVFRMILRGAALRFLLLGHPAVDALAAGAVDQALPPDHQALLERALVETVQIHAKHLERDREMLALLDEHLTPASLGTDAGGRARLFAQAV